MKKIFVLTAVSMMFTAATAFATCPINSTGSCNIDPVVGTPTGAAAPISYIVSPVTERTYLPACSTCKKQPAKKSVFQKIMTPFNGMYNAVFSPFTNLYD